jgi:hypothetical protein
MGYDKTICNFVRDHVYFSARRDAGIAQLVEHLLAKEKVASSSLVSRSNICLGGASSSTICLTHRRYPWVYRDAGIAQLVEHLLAKEKVASSSLVSRSIETAGLDQQFFIAAK